jgi:hypothetical protein
MILKRLHWGNPFLMRKCLILVARLARLERATYGLEVRCSIQLSYRRSLILLQDK